MGEQINSWSLPAKNLDWKMEFRVEDMVDSRSSSARCDNDVAVSPIHFLHSWESERKLIDILITLSEEAYEEEKQPMDHLSLGGGWDDAVHGWRTDNFHSFIPAWKRTKKSRKEKNDNQCVVCAEMAPLIERRTGQDIEQSKSLSTTLMHNLNSSSERTPPAISQTKMHADKSTIAQAQENEACKEINIEDKAKPEMNPHREKEYEIILSTSKKVPVRKHFSLLPPVKIASGGEMSASGVKTGTNFNFDTQNRNLKMVSEENNNNSCLRTHLCNMAMLQRTSTLLHRCQ
ncbi:uncharacterized protein C16orf46 homolog isoform X2 [Narcine bancroftii]|uniref:uncharacterized protein C16orf46 homolog isoform X2 n=1 Tax=Narcine bancroftii TaxID=1343680 RepID=UPI0038319274